MDSGLRKVFLKADKFEKSNPPILKLILIGLLLLAILGFLAISVTIDLEKENFTTLTGPNFTVRGRKLKKGQVYEGIVYGRNTYFGRPSLVPLEGHVNATYAGNPCSPGGYKQTRTCLFLNIYRCNPGKTHKKEQVLVYVGTNRVRNSGVADLVADVALDKYACKGCVLVSVNYRQSAFGYFTTGSENTGNNGIYDVKVALEWIQNNIEHFGGNPKNITVFAAGDGARIVSLLARLPEAKGLLHQLILTSGSSFTPSSIRNFNEGFWSSWHFSKLVHCSDEASWPKRTVPNNSLEIHNCLQKASMNTLTMLDEKIGPNALVQWPFILDKELVRTELTTPEGNVGQSVPTLFLVCMNKGFYEGQFYRSEHVRKILQTINELKLDKFKFMVDYYIRQLTNEKSGRKMPGRWHHHQLIRRIRNNFEILGSALLEAQATASRDVLTYFIFISNRKKDNPYTSLTPLCLGEDLFDAVKSLQKKTRSQKIDYDENIAEIIMNFVIKADPTLKDSRYLWPWYDPGSPDVITLNSGNQKIKIQSISKIETADFWLCEAGKRYLNSTLPEFCNTRKN